MEIKEIKELINVFQQSNLSSFKYQHGEDVLVFKRPAKTQTSVSQPITNEHSEKTAAEYLIKAPLVGTFYASAGPDQPPMIKVGDHIKAGTQVGIIEAMKLINEIKTAKDGTVTKILVSDGEKVEYDQPIIEVNPD